MRQLQYPTSVKSVDFTKTCGITKDEFELHSSLSHLFQMMITHGLLLISIINLLMVKIYIVNL